MRSANGNTQTSIAFVNFRATPVHLWWISYDATRVTGGTVAANGGRQDVTTFLTHPWLITDEQSGVGLGVWFPVPGGGLVVVT